MTSMPEILASAQDPNPPPLWRRALWAFAAALLSFHFALTLQHNATPYLDAQAYTHYEAKRPYQYRLLMAPVMGALMRSFEAPAPKALLAKLPSFVATPEAASYLLINAVALGMSCFLMAAIARLVIGAGRPTQLALAIYLALVYLYLCLNPNLAFILPYDVPALALSQACLLCLLTRRRLALYVLFALAVLNRETVFLVIIFLAAKAGFEPALRRRALIHIVGLSVVWLAIKVALLLRFAGLDSDEGLRLAYNLRTIAKPWQWPALLPILASFGLAAWSLRATPRQREWAVTGCIGFVLVFAVGQITETRAFADLMTYFAIAIAQGLWFAKRPPPA